MLSRSVNSLGPSLVSAAHVCTAFARALAPNVTTASSTFGSPQLRDLHDTTSPGDFAHCSKLSDCLSAGKKLPSSQPAPSWQNLQFKVVGGGLRTALSQNTTVLTQSKAFSPGIRVSMSFPSVDFQSVELVVFNFVQFYLLFWGGGRWGGRNC